MVKEQLDIDIPDEDPIMVKRTWRIFVDNYEAWFSLDSDDQADLQWIYKDVPLALRKRKGEILEECTRRLA